MGPVSIGIGIVAFIVGLIVGRLLAKPAPAPQLAEQALPEPVVEAALEAPKEPEIDIDAISAEKVAAALEQESGKWQSKEEELQIKITDLVEKNDKLDKKKDEIREEMDRRRRWLVAETRHWAEALDAYWIGLSLSEDIESLGEAPDDKSKWQRMTQLAEIAERIAAELGKGSSELHYRLGLIRWLQGQREEACVHFDDSARKGQGLAAWIALGDAWWVLDRRDKAVRAYRNVLNRDDLPERVRTRVAEVSVANWRFKEAYEALSPLLANGNLPCENTLALASLAAGKMGNDERAVELCEKGLAKAPDSVRLLTNMIIPLSRLGRAKDAESTFEKALELDSESAEVPFAMGVGRFKSGDDAGAAKLLENALEINDGFPEAWLCLGQISNRRGEFTEAIGQFKLALEHRPRYAAAYYNMKESYEGLRDFDTALAMLQEASKIDPSYR